MTHGHQFSVDDFESMKTTPWEGVRNAEARNLMKEMRVGDKVCTPGLAGLSCKSHLDCTSEGIVLSFELQKPWWVLVTLE